MPTDDSDPVANYHAIRRELAEYSRTLAEKEEIIVANKMDLEGAGENLTVFRKRFPKVDILPVSAENEVGLDDLRQMLNNEVGHKRDH